MKCMKWIRKPDFPRKTRKDTIRLKQAILLILYHAIYDNFGSDSYTVKQSDNYGLSNVAATVVNLMGYEAPDFWDSSMIEINK